MELTESSKAYLKETARQLKGSARRLFMARTVRELGKGGQSRAEQELGWSRPTLRKGERELRSGFTCADAFSLRGRKRSEETLPHLLSDLRTVVDGQSQTDPQFRSNRLYTRLTAREVRRQLIERHGYTDEELPTERTISNKLVELGYKLRKVRKTQPKKTERDRRDLRAARAGSYSGGEGRGDAAGLDGREGDGEGGFLLPRGEESV